MHAIREVRQRQASEPDFPRTARKQVGLTLEQVAKLTGTSPATISRWERDRNNSRPTARTDDGFGRWAELVMGWVS